MLCRLKFEGAFEPLNARIPTLSSLSLVKWKRPHLLVLYMHRLGKSLKKIISSAAREKNPQHKHFAIIAEQGWNIFHVASPWEQRGRCSAGHKERRAHFWRRGKSRSATAMHSRSALWSAPSNLKLHARCSQRSKRWCCCCFWAPNAPSLYLLSAVVLQFFSICDATPQSSEWNRPLTRMSAHGEKEKRSAKMYRMIIYCSGKTIVIKTNIIELLNYFLCTVHS